jgi:hypothetical protein
MMGASTLGALLLLLVPPTPVGSTPGTPVLRPLIADVAHKPAPPRDESDQPKADLDDVPAPPMSLLFGLAAGGILWGRRLAARQRAAREPSTAD